MPGVVEYPGQMAPIDAMFWALEKDRRLRTTTLAVSILDRPPDRAGLQAIVGRAVERIPRLRQRVVEMPGGLIAPAWRDDPEFLLNDHLQFVTAPPGQGWPFVLDFGAAMATRAFDRTRPLWEFAVIEGLEDGQAALLQKLHHSVGDGAAGVALMSDLYHDKRDTPLEIRPGTASAPLEFASAPEKTPMELLVESLRANIESAPETLASVLRVVAAAAQNPVENAKFLVDEARAVAGIMRSGPGPSSPLWRRRSSRPTFAVLTLPQEKLERAACAAGSTFHDAFLTALALGFRRYHANHRIPTSALRTAFPINVRSESGAFTMGNRLAIGRFDLPCGEMSLSARFECIHDAVRNQRAPSSLAAFESLATLVNFSPIDLILPLILEEMLKSDVVSTVVPGPAEPLYLAGSRVESLFAFGPTAGAAINATLLSHLDEACVAFTLDAAAVQDADHFVECMESGFAEVLHLADEPERSADVRLLRS